MGVDVLGRDAVAFLQEAHQDQPGPCLIGRRRLGDVRIVAGEFDADRVGLEDGVVGRGVVDILVVVAIGAVAVGRDRVFRGRPVDSAVGLNPQGDASAGRMGGLCDGAAAGRTGRSLGLVGEDVFPLVGLGRISERMQVDDLEPGEFGVPDSFAALAISSGAGCADPVCAVHGAAANSIKGSATAA